jgi:RNA recognition motif-containing protein
MIDYTNLYIKNLDPQVTSYDLFQRFRDFGKIISARVMRDTHTSISKGFGFVSFTSMDEANMAMQKMQGVKIHYKAIAITFHEPKKSTQRKGNMEYVPQQPFQQQPYPYIYSANQSPPPPVYGNVYPHHRVVPEHNMVFKVPIFFFINRNMNYTIHKEILPLKLIILKIILILIASSLGLLVYIYNLLIQKIK